MAFSILCVDDEEVVLSLFQDALKRTGYSIFTANNGVDALVMAKEHHPDLVFLDIAMPEMEGSEALPLFHEIDPDTAVVIVSGHVSEDEARKLLAEGAYDFLPKPLDLKHMYDLVEQRRFELEVS